MPIPGRQFFASRSGTNRSYFYQNSRITLLSRQAPELITFSILCLLRTNLGLKIVTSTAINVGEHVLKPHNDIAKNMAEEY